MTTPITPELRKQFEVCRDQITAILERKDKPSGVWKPEIGDEVWVWGETYPVTRVWDNQLWNQIFYVTDQIHPTAEACQHAHDKRVAQVKYERLAAQAWLDEGKVIDWDNGGQQKYRDTRFTENSAWEVYQTDQIQIPCVVYFPSAMSAIAAREAMGADMDLLL